MIKGLETKINSINEGDIEYPNKIPEEAKNTTFLGKRLELEKSIIKSLPTRLLRKLKMQKRMKTKEHWKTFSKIMLTPHAKIPFSAATKT